MPPNAKIKWCAVSGAAVCCTLDAHVSRAGLESTRRLAGAIGRLDPGNRDGEESPDSKGQDASC